MIHRSCTYQLAFASNLISNLCCQVTDLNRMLERARCHLTHLPEERLVHIRQFDKGDVGCKAERLFYQIEERVGAEQQQAVNGEVIIFAIADLHDIVILDPVRSQIHQCSTYSYEHSCPEELRTAGQFA